MVLPDRESPEYLEALADVLNELGDDGDEYFNEAIALDPSLAHLERSQ
jgi:hypothetical protein